MTDATETGKITFENGSDSGGSILSTDGRHRNPKFPVVYALLYPMLVQVAARHGYAMALHGSMTCDLDLIAVPWMPEASDSETLVNAVIESLEGVFVHKVGKVGAKPHGRVCHTIYLDNHGYIDLSIMPRADLVKEGAE